MTETNFLSAVIIIVTFVGMLFLLSVCTSQQDARCRQQYGQDWRIVVGRPNFCAGPTGELRAVPP